MAWLKFIVYAYIAVVLQTVFFPVVLPDYLRPWPLVILANRYLLGRSNDGSILLVWVIGLLGDLTSLSPLGAQALSYGLYGLLIRQVRPVLFADSAFAYGVTSFAGVIIILAVYALLAAVSRQMLPLPFSVVDVLGQAVATGAAAALVAKLFAAPRRHSPARR
jgi:rod shape-determining protein MreD